MKKTGFAFALLVLALMSCDRAQAQKPGPQTAAVTIAPDLTKLNIEKRRTFSRALKKLRLCRLWRRFCN